MRDYFKLKTWLMTFVLIYLSLGISMVLFSANVDFSPKIALAADNGASSNVHGFAWSELYGWISFNCSDVPLSCNGGTNYRLPCAVAVDCPSGACVNTCTISNYGVTIDTAGSGGFSGHAWSSNFGWISFDRSETGNPLQNPYQAGTYIANYNIAAGVTGWGKVLALGDYGWLRLDGTWTPDVSVVVNSGNGDFRGWAWNGNAAGETPGIGWVSFNCLDDPGGCSNPYKVSITGLNTPPTATPVTSRLWSYDEVCNNSLGAKWAVMNWTFNDVEDGGQINQTAYQVILDTSDTGYQAGNANTHTTSTPLAYDTTYNWSVKVWDSQGLTSGFVPGPSFKTYAHDFPKPNFISIPSKPSKKEAFRLSGSGSYYNSGLGAIPYTAIPCPTNPDGAVCKWRWTLPADMTVVEGVANASSTIIVTATNAGNKTIYLNLSDNTQGYSCTSTQIINLKSGLPSIKEVK